ncbi:hypothetical protein LDENG_00065190 [Lucifuga dentata]|nr:hypothetical protein LDENG_00065190 [Lucifuga dentata]
MEFRFSTITGCSTTTMNISEEEDQGLYQENIVFSTFYILVFIFAVPGNALALWAFFRQESTSSSKEQL